MESCEKGEKQEKGKYFSGEIQQFSGSALAVYGSSYGSTDQDPHSSWEWDKIFEKWNINAF